MNFIVEVSDIAEMEAKDILFQLMGRPTDAADRWQTQWLDALASLEFMPRKYPLAPENDHYPYEIRQLRFGNYRILFTFKDFDNDGEDDTVWLMRVRHTAQQWLHLENGQ